MYVGRNRAPRPNLELNTGPTKREREWDRGRKTPRGKNTKTPTHHPWPLHHKERKDLCFDIIVVVVVITTQILTFLSTVSITLSNQLACTYTHHMRLHAYQRWQNTVVVVVVVFFPLRDSSIICYGNQRIEKFHDTFFSFSPFPFFRHAPFIRLPNDYTRERIPSLS
ncbi:hypothetical protein F5X99DRAFT_141083 [Biscogniauxia marginata]|nr:hypothetical protein F5X99DRAFT_141083 [Biscogniauxia marginata]